MARRRPWRLPARATLRRWWPATCVRRGIADRRQHGPHRCPGGDLRRRRHAAALADGRFDRVLVDAPCSGLGTLRRRPDARWRIDPDAPARLAALQHRLVDEAVRVLAPGGMLVYSVCTLSAVETRGVDEHLAAAHPELAVPEGPELPGGPWRALGRGALLLPQAADTDGMYVLRLCRS
ncbi:MAG: hypothetical protein R2755_06805 [Acidimicrobiales bacterium]